MLMIELTKFKKQLNLQLILKYTLRILPFFLICINSLNTIRENDI